jgi:hypothetical protein
MEMYLLYWFAILFVFFGLRYLILKKQQCVSNKASRILLTIHLVPVVLLLISIVFYFYDLSFRGYDSTSIIFMSSVATGIPFYLLRKKEFLKPILNYILIGICSFSVPSFVVCTYFTLTNYKAKVYYEDDTYRLQRTFKGIMSSKTFPDLFVKKGIIEKRYISNEEPIDHIQSIRIVKNHPDSIVIIVHHPDMYDTSKTLSYSIRIKE